VRKRNHSEISGGLKFRSTSGVTSRRLPLLAMKLSHVIAVEDLHKRPASWLIGAINEVVNEDL
jgi:hypothetical protein